MLNPKIFTQENDFSMREEVREQLLDIALDFSAKAMVESTDIVIVGSNASHSYDDKSDIDLHIILPQDEQLLEEVRALAKEANEHKKSVEGIDVEIYAQGEEEENRSAGIYSLINGWIKRPAEPTESTKPLMPDIESNVEVMKDKIEEADKGEEANELMSEIKEMRKAGLRSGDGETSTGNLVFKKLRRDGDMKKLSNKTTDSLSKAERIKQKLVKFLEKLGYDEEDAEEYVVVEETDNGFQIRNDIIGFYEADKQGLIDELQNEFSMFIEPYDPYVWDCSIEDEVKDAKAEDTLVKDPSVVDAENYVIGNNGIWFAKDKSERELLTKAYCSTDEGKTWHTCYFNPKSGKPDGRTQIGKMNIETSYGVSPRTAIGRNILTWYAAHGIHEIDRDLEIDHKNNDYTDDHLENLRRIPHDMNVKSDRDEQFRLASIASGIGDAYEVVEIKGNALPDEKVEEIMEWSGAKITFKNSTYIIEGTSDEVDEAAGQINIVLAEEDAPRYKFKKGDKFLIEKVGYGKRYGVIKELIDGIYGLETFVMTWNQDKQRNMMSNVGYRYMDEDELLNLKKVN